MKKVPQTQKKLNLSIILDKLTDLGWEYTCGCMTRSGMQTYDELMQYIGVLDPTNTGTRTATKTNAVITNGILRRMR